MKLELIEMILEDMIVEIKEAISNISLDKYSESIYNLLNLYDSVYELSNKINKPND